MVNENNFEPVNIIKSKKYLYEKYNYVKRRYSSGGIFKKFKKFLKRLF